MPKVKSQDGTTIAYDKKGEGPLLILVLGALNRKSQGKKLSDLLADQFTVVSYDRRGRGDSTDTLPYSIEKEVQDVDALIAELGESAFLYGHSSGCILALLAAQKLGNKINGMVLYELPYNSDPKAQADSKTYRNQLKDFLSIDKRGDAVALFVKSVGVTDKQIAAMQKLPMWKGLTAMAQTLAYDTIELMELYPKLEVKDIGVKSLILYGAKSPDFMGETAKELSKKMPHAQVQSLEDQIHDVKAHVLAPELAKFFNPA